MTSNIICILGLSGGIGGAVADALLRHGFHVRALVRDPLGLPSKWSQCANVTLVPGDAMQADHVALAAEGCFAIVHGVNPSGYRNWDTLVLPMIENTIAAARAAGGARIVLPGTIYNFDPAQTAILDEHSPQQPKTEKGLIRRELELRLERAAADGCPALILRAGDFFGPDARSSWFTQSMIRPGGRVRLVNPGKGVGHSWAYLPDLADTFARLIAIEDRLLPFERLQFEGTWDRDGSLIPATIRDVLGRAIPEHAFPWWLMRLLAPFGGFPAAVRDVEPYWRHGVHLDNRRLVELLGCERRTPLFDAIRTTLGGLADLNHLTAKPSLALA